MQKPCFCGLKFAIMELDCELFCEVTDVEQGDWVVGKQRVEKTEKFLSLGVVMGTSEREEVALVQARIIYVRRGVWSVERESWWWRRSEFAGWISNRPRIF